MRIIIDVDEDRRRRMIRLRTRYYANGKDGVRVHNSGLATYELIRDAISMCAEGGIIEHQGEAR